MCLSLLFLVVPVSSLTISVVGAQGRLGRELVVQSLERGWKVNGIVRRPDDPVFFPSRKGWLVPNLQEDMRRLPVVDPNLSLTCNTTCSKETDAVVFAMSSKPFSSKVEMQVQNEVVRRICSTSKTSACKKVCLVSAFGAGDSLQGSNVGYQVMHDFYLKEGYSAKEEQERIVSSSCGDGVNTLILRPKVLSFQKIPFNPFSVVRSELASQILDWVEEE